MSKLPYTAIVKILLEGIRASGLALDVLDPHVFHPIPHFARSVHVFGVSSQTHVCGTRIPEPDVVMQHSCAFSQTCISWGRMPFLDTVVKPDSLYSKVFAFFGLPSLDGRPMGELTLPMGELQPGPPRSFS